MKREEGRNQTRQMHNKTNRQMPNDKKLLIYVKEFGILTYRRASLVKWIYAHFVSMILALLVLTNEYAPIVKWI